MSVRFSAVVTGHGDRCTSLDDDAPFGRRLPGESAREFPDMPSRNSAIAFGFRLCRANGLLAWSVARRSSEELLEFVPGRRSSSSSRCTNIKKHSRAAGPLWSHASCGIQSGLISDPSLICEECPISANQKGPILCTVTAITACKASSTSPGCNPGILARTSLSACQISAKVHGTLMVP